jgi:hypothetical protein
MTKVWVNGQRSDESYGLGKGGNNIFVLLLHSRFILSVSILQSTVYDPTRYFRVNIYPSLGTVSQGTISQGKRIQENTACKFIKYRYIMVGRRFPGGSTLALILVSMAVVGLLDVRNTNGVVSAFTTKQQDHHKRRSPSSSTTTTTVAFKTPSVSSIAATTSTADTIADATAQKYHSLVMSQPAASTAPSTHENPIAAFGVDNTAVTHAGSASLPANHLYYPTSSSSLTYQEDDEDEELIGFGTALFTCALSLAIGFSLGYGT